MDVGIIGCGAIGSEVAHAASRMEGVGRLLLYDIDPDAVSTLADLPKAELTASAQDLVAACDILVEAANKGVVQDAVLAALQAGKRTVVLTVGALADPALRAGLLAAARENGGKIHIPSGAVMGIDGLRAAAAADLRSVTLVTTKPPAGLDQPLEKWTLLFDGSARDAVKRFPKNVNVAATLSLAGLGFDETKVQVALDPLANRNSHKVIFEGAFGRARIEVENLPSPSNPATSHLASLSTIAVLERLLSPIEIGA